MNVHELRFGKTHAGQYRSHYACAIPEPSLKVKRSQFKRFDCKATIAFTPPTSQNDTQRGLSKLPFGLMGCLSRSLIQQNKRYSLWKCNFSEINI
jgi:hypothetical protein